MRIDERINIFLSIIGVVSVFSLTIRYLIANRGFTQIITDPSIYVVSAAVILFFILIFFRSDRLIKINQIIHFAIFIIFGSINIFQDFESWYGIGFIVLALLIGYKYGFFNKYKIIKVLCLSLYLLLIIERSTYINTGRFLVGFGVEALIYLLFFLGILLLCYYDDLHLSRKNIVKLKKEKKRLEDRIIDETSRVRELNEQIEILETSLKPFDLSKCNISNAEMTVLECLVVYSAGNSEIAKRLSKAEDTVKVQIRSLFDKIGAENRYQLIDLCKNNFIDK